MNRTYWILVSAFAAMLIAGLGVLDFSEQLVRSQIDDSASSDRTEAHSGEAQSGDAQSPTSNGSHEHHEQMASLRQDETAPGVLIQGSSNELPVYGSAPDFAFENFQGKTISRSDVDGQPWVVSFFFTSCEHVCPTINARVSKLAKRFEEEGVRFVSVSVDPQNDTQQAIREYAIKYGANPNRWHLLRGNLDKVFTFMRDGLKLGSGTLPDIHTTRVTLVDQNNKIRGYYHGLDSRSMAKLGDDLDLLLRSE